LTKQRFLLLVSLLAAAYLLFSPTPALAQVLSLDLGDDAGSTTSRIIQILLLTTVLTLAPSVLG
jgi:flagellar biosynthetic protein FliP